MTRYRITDAEAERFWSKVEPFAGLNACWQWTACTDRGYGRFKVQRDGVSRGLKAHRVAYQLLRGDLDPDMPLDHLCRNRACVNPDHLEQVTNAENIRRGNTGKNIARTYVGQIPVCRNGHQVTGDNERPVPGSTSICIACFKSRRRKLPTSTAA